MPHFSYEFLKHLDELRSIQEMPYLTTFQQHLDELRSIQDMPYLTTFQQHLNELGQVHVHWIGSSHLKN